MQQHDSDEGENLEADECLDLSKKKSIAKTQQKQQILHHYNEQNAGDISLAAEVASMDKPKSKSNEVTPTMEKEEEKVEIPARLIKEESNVQIVSEVAAKAQTPENIEMKETMAAPEQYPKKEEVKEK